jgi:hypothetical protein
MWVAGRKAHTPQSGFLENIEKGGNISNINTMLELKKIFVFLT